MTRGRSRERHPRRLSGCAAARSEPRRHRARRDETPTRRVPTSCNPASAELNRKDKSPPPSPKQKSRFRPGYVYRRRRNTTSAGTVGNEACSGALSAPLEVAATHGLIDVSRAFSRILESLPQVQGGSSSPLLHGAEDALQQAPDSGGLSSPTIVEGVAAATSTATDDSVLKTIFVPPSAAVLEAVEPTAAPAVRNNRPRSFNVSAVRRSARIAATKPMPTMKRAQQNLCRKLGLLKTDDRSDFDVSLQKFTTLFKGPLPKEVIAALESLFNLNTVDAELVDEALMEAAGDGIAEIQESAAELQEEARRNACSSLLVAA
jgi:hypothetical protein